MLAAAWALLSTALACGLAGARAGRARGCLTVLLCAVLVRVLAGMGRVLLCLLRVSMEV